MTATDTRVDPRIRIILNGDAAETAARTLAELVEEMGFAGARIATALNGTFVAAHARRSAALHPGDKVEIVAPRQGG